MQQTASAEDDRRVRLIALGAALALTAQALRFRALNFAIDDAWISFRVARNLLLGQGLVYEPSLPPTEGMTNLLWTLLSAVWIALAPGLDPIFAARILGLGCAVAAVVLVIRTAADLVPSARAPAALLAALLCASNANLVYHAMSGLETGLYLLCVVGGARAAWLGPADGRAVGLWAALAAWTRPEGVLLGAGFVGFSLLRHRAAAWRALLIFGLAVGAMEVFRLAYYGRLTPNTFSAKPPNPAAGLRYTLGWLASGAGLIAGLALLGVDRRARALAAVTLLYVGVVASSGADWMSGWRRLLDAWILLVPMAAAAAASTTTRRALAGVAVAMQLWTYRSLDTAGTSYPHLAFAEIGRVAAATPGVNTIASFDIGRLGWAFPGAILDLGGLTDPHIAALPGGYFNKAWDDAYFRQRAPDLILVTVEANAEGFRIRDVDAPVVAAAAAQGDYEIARAIVTGGGTTVWVIARAGLELPERLWGPRSGPSLRELRLPGAP